MKEITSSEELRNYIELETGLETDASIEMPEVESRWDLYVTDMDGQKALVLVDMALFGKAPFKGYSNLFGLQMAIQDPTEDGFYTEEEQEVLFKMEDRIVAVFEERARARVVAAVTTGGARILYFYAPNADVLGALVGQIAAEFGEYDFNYMIDTDGPWNFYYHALYPSDLELQLLNNRKVYSALVQGGFDVAQERPVSHWFFFENGAKRRQCAVRLMMQGHEVLDDNFYEEEMGEKAFGLRTMKVQNVELETLYAQTYDYFEMMDEFEGVYDGWELMDEGSDEE